MAKIQFGGLVLGDQAQRRLDALSAAYPHLRLADNESDEFSHWMSGTGDPDYQQQRVIRPAPYKREALVPWLRNAPADDEYFDEDTWRDVCRKHFLNSLYALGDLAGKANGSWGAGRRLSRYGANQVLLGNHGVMLLRGSMRCQMPYLRR